MASRVIVGWDSDNKDEINIVLLGKTGNGKSSSGNAILGRNVFHEGDNTSSVTKLASLEASQNELTRSIVNVVDTPGLMDTKNDDVISIISQSMSLCPSGFNAVIIALRYGNTFTKEEQECINTLKQHLGSNFIKKYGIIIMTYGENFKLNHKEISFSDWCRGEDFKGPFGQLLAECQGRCVLFYNKGKKHEEKRKNGVLELLNIIRTQIPRRYRCERFDSAVETRKLILEKINMPVLNKNVQAEISLTDEKIERDIRARTLSVDDMAYHARRLQTAINELSDSCEGTMLKDETKLITDKINDLKVEKDVDKRIAMQQTIRTDLRSLKNPPSKSPIITANIKLIFAKFFFYPIGVIFSLGLAKAFLRNLVLDLQLNLEAEIKKFDEKILKDKIKDAKQRVPQHQSISNS
ncbi:unnamed protein product [Lymnaea stagnalis]|uniref:AIG1-type G domain-containing protein n=1 Tax=Lymnaea stagnalis TaxID=6523 RepID=A0AAV2I0B9_LYMST